MSRMQIPLEVLPSTTSSYKKGKLAESSPFSPKPFLAMKQRFTLKHPPSRGHSCECRWVAQVDRRHPPLILQNAAANLEWWLDLHVWGLWFLLQPGPWLCSVTNAGACLLHPKPAAVGRPMGRG